MKKIITLVSVFMFAVSSASFAAENESWIQKIKNRFQKKAPAVAAKSAPVKEARKAEPPAKQRKDMTKGELAADITKNLGREESILNLVPGLEKKTDPEGKGYYTYEGTKLEDLDRDALDKVFGRVRSEALRLRTDRINRQIETVRRANVVTARVPQTPKVQVPPRINTSPQVPRPVQPPSKPPVPPAPPRR